MRALALVLVVGCGGDSGAAAGGAELDRLRLAARTELATVTPDSLSASATTLRQALELEPQDLEALGQLEANAGFGALLYDQTIDTPRLAQPFVRGKPGWHDHLVGDAAKQLAQAKNVDAVRAVLSTLDREIASNPAVADDPRLYWLRGRAALLLGDRVLATQALEVASREVGKVRFAPAVIDRAYLLASNNKVGDAIQLASMPDIAKHPLATIARATIRAEAGITLGDAITELKSVSTTFPTLQARAEVANMLVALAGERYDMVAAALKKLGSSRVVPADCAVWARIAWAYLQLGRAGEAGRSDHRAASVTRDRCSFARAHPLLSVVDASLHLGLGRFEAAYATASKVDHPWARVVAAEALLELGDPAAAKKALAATDAQTPLGFATRLVLQQAEVLLVRAKPKDLVAEISHLEGLADNAKTQRGRHTLGATQLALGDLMTAKAELRRALADTTETSPNPRANRTRTLLAEIAFAEGDLELAAQEIGQALAIHANDQIALSLQARLALRRGDADAALQALATMRKSGWLPPIAKLVVAEALVARKAVTADERDQAKKLVTGLVGQRVVAPTELGRVAALVDPQLPRQLKLPVGKLPGKGA